MGTNYYMERKLSYKDKQTAMRLLKEDKVNDLISHLCDVNEMVHIGKCSIGWKFLFNHNNNEFYASTRESIDEFLHNEEYILKDEYGECMSVDDFWKMVDNHQNQLDGDTYDMQDDTRMFKVADYEYTTAEGLRFSTSTDFS